MSWKWLEIRLKMLLVVMMSNELTKFNDFDSTIAQVDNIQKLCIMLLKTPYFKAMGESGVLSILFASKAVGIDPFQGLNGGFYIVSGKVGMSTELMSCLIRRAGHSIDKDPESDATFCRIKGTRKDTGDTMTVTFTWNDAITAQLIGKDIWKKYPAIMLYNRAMSILSRQLFADVIKGYGYSEDELQEIKETKAIDVKPVSNHIEDMRYMIKKPVVNESLTTEERTGKDCPLPLETASKESVDRLLELVKQTPQERQDNFSKIVISKGWLSYYDMSQKFVDTMTSTAQLVIAQIKEKQNVS